MYFYEFFSAGQKGQHCLYMSLLRMKEYKK